MDDRQSTHCSDQMLQFGFGSLTTNISTAASRACQSNWTMSDQAAACNVVEQARACIALDIQHSLCSFA